MTDELVLELPFQGQWQARNSPARRVPSHGTHAFGVTYAIDFVAVNVDGRSAPHSWRSKLWHEPPEVFLGFGAPILAPVAGVVVVAHDGERDHVARRSPFARVRYALGQARRVTAGIGAVAGNHAVIAVTPSGPFVALAHLRRGSLRVAAGDDVEVGEEVGECGNSGNSTEPHLHVQATDTIEWHMAAGLPIVFRRGGDTRSGQSWVPEESEIVHGRTTDSG